MGTVCEYSVMIAVLFMYLQYRIGQNILILDLLNPLDYFLNINEIDEQLEAIKLGLA
jgi:hypothetical protein